MPPSLLPSLPRSANDSKSPGHPLGATGLGVAFYLTTQLRGWAGPMQVPRAAPSSSEVSYALGHNLGLGRSFPFLIFSSYSSLMEFITGAVNKQVGRVS